MARGTMISFLGAGSVWAIVILVLLLPYGNPLLNYAFIAIPWIFLTGCFASIYIPKQRSPSQFFVRVSLFVGCFAAYFLISGVTFRNDLIAPALSGQISSVTRSENHQYPEVQIQQVDGSIETLTGVSEAFFGAVRVGDVVHKSAGAVSVAMGARRMEIADHSMLDIMRFGVAGR